MFRHRSCLRDHHSQPETEPPVPERKGWTKFAERTRAKHARIHELKDAGHGIRSIARQLRMGSGTVIRYVRAETADELLWGQWTTKPSKVDDYKPYLHQRWEEGERNAARLLEEITAMGYRGSYGALSAYLRPLRVPQPVTAAAPSARKVTGWITTRPDRLDEEHELQLKAIQERCPELDALARHVRDFAVILTQRQGQDLPTWIAAVRADALPSLHGFAGGLERDLDAVITGLTLALELRPGRGSRQSHQDAQTPDVRPSRVPAAAQASPQRPLKRNGMALSLDPTRRRISADLRRVAQARRDLALQHPQDHDVYEAEARAYSNAAAIAEGDTSMIRVLTAHTD
ncbi:hypothetical protein [Actinomadura rugatobispora]|uniref:HTH IS21-type domain-containing protein n=1 Tax=Actinomadura rugatobispora TaxID=1994 RepID=A0ABW1A079_9ACTN|nr:hypothetical protein GCM10010200_100390 [Actinomadura rugatobispora]